MLIQSILLNGYGRTPGRGQESYATIDAIVAEAMRVPANLGHVSQLIKPNLVYSVDPKEVAAEAISLSLLGRDRIGRRLRSNGVVPLAGCLRRGPATVSSCRLGG